MKSILLVIAMTAPAMAQNMGVSMGGPANNAKQDDRLEFIVGELFKTPRGAKWQQAQAALQKMYRFTSDNDKHRVRAKYVGETTRDGKFVIVLERGDGKFIRVEIDRFDPKSKEVLSELRTYKMITMIWELMAKDLLDSWGQVDMSKPEMAEFIEKAQPRPESQIRTNFDDDRLLFAPEVGAFNL